MREIRAGYKQTELGLIPTDWDVRPLGMLVTSLEAGVSVNSLDANKEESTHDLSILKTSCVFGGKFMPDERKPIVTRDIHRAKLNPRKDTIVFSRMNTPALVGECGYIDRDYSNLFLPDRLWMTRHDGRIPHCVRWLAFLLSSSAFNRAIKESATGTSGSMKNISKGSLLAVPIPFPPTKAEQEAIAEALSNAESLIESLEQLLAKKRHLKQGAMQELLTGKKRLPGFSGEWEVKRLGDVSQLKNGYAFQSSTYTPIGSYKVVTIANVQDGFMTVAECNKIARLPSDIQSHQCLSRNDILISMTGNVGRVCRVSDDNCLLNQRVGKLLPSGIDSDFLFTMLCQPKFLVAMGLKAKGGAQGNLSKPDITEYEIPVPPPSEQVAIAAVLFDMDAEIAELESELAKTRALKQGMMQKLLTGEIRLI